MQDLALSTWRKEEKWIVPEKVLPSESLNKKRDQKVTGWRVQRGGGGGVTNSRNLSN